MPRITRRIPPKKKRGDWKKASTALWGWETAFPVLYTELVRPGVLTLAQLIDLMHTNPAKRFGIGAPLEEGATADFTVFDLDAEETIQPEHFLSMGKSSPFAGRSVFGTCLLTICGGKIAWQAEGGASR